MEYEVYGCESITFLNSSPYNLVGVWLGEDQTTHTINTHDDDDV